MTDEAFPELQDVRSVKTLPSGVVVNAENGNPLFSGDVLIRVAEELTADDERQHTNEIVGYAAFNEGAIRNSAGQIVGVAIRLTHSQSVANQWRELDIAEHFPDGTDLSDMVVTASPLTSNGGADSFLRIDTLGDASDTSFRFRLEEWSSDGTHPSEELQFVVMLPGAHELWNGTNLVAGTVSTGQSWTRTSLNAGAGVSAPVVLANINSYHGADDAVIRLQNVSNGGFDVRVQEAQGLDGAHAAENIGYIAIEGGTGIAETTTDRVNNKFAALDVNAGDVFVASIQTYNGADTANLRWKITGGLKNQTDFLNATAWRFATHKARQEQSPRNRLLSQSDLTVTAQTGAYLGQGSFDALGHLNVTSLAGFIAESADLSGSQINITAAGDLTGYGLALEATDDISLFSVGAVNITGLGRTYTNETGFENIIGTLSNENWAGQRVGSTGAGTRIMVSQELSKITSGSDLTISALGDLTLGGVTADINGNVTLNTNTNLALNAPRSVIEYHVGGGANGTDLWDIRSHATEIKTGGSFSALAGDTVLLEGAKIDAGSTLDLSATNDVTVSTAQNIYEYSHRTYSSSLFGKKSSHHSITRLLHAGADLTSNGTLNIESQEGNLTTAGSRFESQSGDINLSATEGDVLAGVFTDIDRESSEYHKSSFFGFISSSGTSLVDHRDATGTAALADLDLTIVSGGDTELVGAQLSAGRDLNLNVGGDLRVLAAIDSTREEFFESKMGVVLATTLTERSHKETAVLTSLNAKGELNISVGGKTYLSLYGYEGEDGQTAAELYPEELASLANLILLDEELLDEYFYEETKSLSPAFIAILSIALTAGFGSMLAAQFPALTTGGAAAAGGTATAADLTLAGKAVASFAASSTIGLANGAVSGDIDLEDILKNAALSAGTQLLTSSLNLRIAGDTAGADALAEAGEAANAAADAIGNQGYALLGGSWGEGFTKGLFVEGGKLTGASVLEGAFDATLSSGFSSAITGSDFREGLTTSFVRSVVALGLADTQNQIGGIGLEEGSFSHALLHGLAGCTAAELSGADCRAGAAAGITQSIYAGTLGSVDIQGSHFA